MYRQRFSLFGPGAQGGHSAGFVKLCDCWPFPHGGRKLEQHQPSVSQSNIPREKKKSLPAGLSLLSLGKRIFFRHNQMISPSTALTRLDHTDTPNCNGS